MTEPAFINPTLLGTCPKCKQKEQVTIRTRTTSEGFTRRRKECRECGHRATSYEVDEAFYTRSKALLSKLTEMLELFENTSTTTVCDTCEFNTGDRCDHEFPEFGTQEAKYCTLYILHKDS